MNNIKIDSYFSDVISWDREYKYVSNTSISVIVPTSCLQGTITSLICDRLSINCRLINFWEI